MMDPGAGASSALAELIVRSATDFAIITSDTNGVITSSSPGAEKTMGWSAADAVGQRVDLFFTPEDVAEGLPQAELECARDEGSANDERWHMKADGSRFWANGEMQPLREGGEIVGFVKILRDRTEQHGMERQLRSVQAQAEKLAVEQAAILGQLGEGVIATDAEGRIKFVNAAAERLHGVARLDIEPDAYSDTYQLLTEDGLPYPSAKLPLARAVLRGETVTDARWRIRRPDGTEVLAIGNAQPVIADGRQVGAVLTVRDDTARREAESALAMSELRARGVLEGMDEGFVNVDGYMRILQINAEGLRIDGRPREEIVGRTLLEVWPESEHLPNFALFNEVLRTGQPGTIEYRHRSDVHDVWLETRAYPIDGGLAIFYRDVTDRRSATDAISEREARFRELADNIPTLCWTAHANGDIYWYNKRWYEYSGTTPDTQLGWGWEAIHHPVFLPEVTRQWSHSVATGTPFSLTFPLKGADGKFRRFLTRVVPIFDEQGQVVRWFGTNIDVEEQTAAEERMLASEKQYRTLFEAIDAGFCILELKFDEAERAVDYRMAEVNPAFARQTGLVDPAGKWISEAAPGIEQHWMDSYGEVAKTRQSARFERESPALGRWFDVYAFAVDEPEAQLVAVLFNDITDRKRAEEELREQTRTLETLNRTGAALAGDLDLERLVQRVTDAGVELTGAAMGAFFYNVADKNGQSMMLYTLSGISRDAFDVFGMPRATAIFQPTFVGEGVIRSDDILQDWRYGQSTPHHGMPEGHPSVRSYLAVSVTSRSGEVIGGLFFGHPEPGRFTDRHEKLIVGIAAQAAIAIDNARLFDDAQRELSERRRAEAALTELNRTLEARVAATVAERDMIWRTSQDLFVVTGLDGIHRSVNPAWTDALGYEPAELIGSLAGVFIHPDDVDEARAELARLAEGHVINGLDLRMLHKDGGTRWVSWTCVPQGDVFYASGRDVTARKELEEQLRQSQKMEAVGQLTGGIAHDFNNLLTIVSGNIDMARRSLGADGDTRALRSLGNAAKGADRAAALTQRLLAFSRRQPLQPRATDVNKLITGMTELLDRALGETVDLQVVAGAGLWRVEVDPNQLENAILNLAVNARDAMADDRKGGGGKLTIETSNSAIDEAYVAAHREVAVGQYVLLSVTDTGEGMPSDIVAKAFDPFFSTKEVGKGTGLGLSQVYGYVKQSGGHVKIYSEAGEGTTVKLYLPRLIADMNAAEEEAADPEVPSQGRESILVVEDDDDVRIYTVDSLRELGYRVLEAHDGASALRLLERQEEPPSLLLTDVVMPGMSGRELADQARTLYPDMQILYTTGYARNAIVHGGRLDPGVELLPKPFTFDALAAKVRDVIERAVVERALVIDPADDARGASAALLEGLAFAVEQAGTIREALGKLRAARGGFDVVVLSDAVPVGNLDAVLEELHAVRSNMPVLIVGSGNPTTLKARYQDAKCIGLLESVERLIWRVPGSIEVVPAFVG